MKSRTYEAMFVFDPGIAANWQAVEAEVGRIMERAGAEVIGVSKWDERRLAYEIERRKRACFVLTYFRAPRDRIAGIEQDARLSEVILRLLVVRSDLTEEQLAEFRDKATEQADRLRKEAQERAERAEEPAPEEQAVPAIAGRAGDTEAEQTVVAGEPPEADKSALADLDDTVEAAASDEAPELAEAADDEAPQTRETTPNT